MNRLERPTTKALLGCDSSLIWLASDANPTVGAESDEAVSVGVVPKIFVPARGDVLDWTAVYVTEDLIGRTGNV